MTPPSSCRKFWDRPDPKNEFAEAWWEGKIDLCTFSANFFRRAALDAATGDAGGLAMLERLADAVARRSPGFDPELFLQLVLLEARRLSPRPKRTPRKKGVA